MEKQCRNYGESNKRYKTGTSPTGSLAWCRQITLQVNYDPDFGFNQFLKKLFRPKNGMNPPISFQRDNLADIKCRVGILSFHNG